MSHNRQRLLGSVLAVLALGLTMPVRPAFGQTVVLSDILGQVTDASGGSVPGAAVTVTNQGTGFVRTVQSDSSGAYLVNDIVSGVYTVTVVKTGFTKYVRTDLDLTAARKLRIDVVLALGQVTQSVTVTGGTPVIQTETAAVSSGQVNEVINAIPEAGSTQGGRLAYSFFAYLVPGAANISAASNRSGASAASYDGLPDGPGASRLTVDGVRAAETCCQQLPSLEAIGEIKVDTLDAPAEYKTPSTVEMVTRQGVNSFHGDAWELYDDKSLQARDFYLPQKQLFHGSTFGGSIGGPIVKKDKAFFYFGFEEFKLSNLTLSNQSVTGFNIATAAMQNGDFSQLLNPSFVNSYNRGASVTVKDPLTGQPFPSNMIPANRISPIAQNFVKKFWPTPTGPGLLNNYFVNALHPYERDKEDVRVDYNFSSRHTMFVRFGRTGLVGLLPTVGFSLANTSNNHQLFPGYTAGLSDTIIINPRMTNEFRYGFSRTELQFTNPYASQNEMASLGFQNTQGTLGLPGLSFNNFSGISTFTHVGVQQVSGVADNFSIFTGRHELKAGMIFNRNDNFGDGYISPVSFGFTGGLSGYDFADFLLGQPTYVFRTTGFPMSYEFQNELGLYVQDSLKARSNLTLQLGLRYDLQPNPYEKYNKFAMYDIAKQALVVPNSSALKFVVPNFPQAQVPILTASQAGWPANNRSLINTALDGFSPRFGFAWRPRRTENTVIRGGYGVYRYNEILGVGDGPNSPAFSGSQFAFQALGSNGILTPTIAWPNPFGGFGATSTFNPATLSYNTVNPNLRPPVVQEYSLTAEHQWRGLGMRGTYFGDFETGIIYGSDFNQPLPSNQPFSQSRLPIPNALGINIYQNGGFQRVNGFQTEVRRPTSHGLMFDGSWTWMKCLATVTQAGTTDTPFVPPIGAGGYYDRNRFESNCDFEPHQNAIFSWVWSLPVGSGQKYLSSAPWLVKGVLGGWQVTGAASFATGIWLSPYYTGVDPAGMSPGVGAQLPDRIANGNFSRGQRNGLTAPFFNTSAFMCPGGSTMNGQPNLLTAGCPLSTPQNVGRLGNSSPDIIEGPGSNTMNLAVTKKFSLGREGRTLQVSAQMANPWNHPDFTQTPPVNLSSPSTVGLYGAAREDFLQPWSYGFRKISLEARIEF